MMCNLSDENLASTISYLEVLRNSLNPVGIDFEGEKEKIQELIDMYVEFYEAATHKYFEKGGDIS